MFFSDQDDEMETESTSDMDSDMEDEENSTSCAANGNGTDVSYSIEKLPVEVTECIASNNIVSKIMAKTILPAENVLKIFEDSPTGQDIYMR